MRRHLSAAPGARKGPEQTLVIGEEEGPTLIFRRSANVGLAGRGAMRGGVDRSTSPQRSRVASPDRHAAHRAALVAAGVYTPSAGLSAPAARADAEAVWSAARAARASVSALDPHATSVLPLADAVAAASHLDEGTIIAPSTRDPSPAGRLARPEAFLRHALSSMSSRRARVGGLVALVVIGLTLLIAGLASALRSDEGAGASSPGACRGAAELARRLEAVSRVETSG